VEDGQFMIGPDVAHRKTIRAKHVDEYRKALKAQEDESE
jgi:hypothetical protein